MAANIKNHVRRAHVLVRPLSDFSGDVLLIQCSRCHSRRRLLVCTLVASHGGQHLVGHVLNRLVCKAQGCKAIPGFVSLHTRLHRVILHGPGAYD